MIAVALLLVVFICIYWSLKTKYEYWKKREVRHPKPNLLFGNIGKIVCLQETLSNLCNNLYDKYPNDAFVGFYNMWSPAIVLRDINLIKDVLIKNFHNFEDHFLSSPKEVDPTLALNPVCLKGVAWKNVRSQLTSQFTSSKVKMALPVLQKVGNDMLFYIQQQIALEKSTCFGVKELSRRFTGETVFMFAFGLQANSFTDKEPITFKIGEEIAGSGLTIKIKHLIGLLFPFLGKLLKITFIGSPITKHFQEVIMDNVRFRKTQTHTRNDYIDYILKLKSVKDEDIVGHAFTYYLNGFETSGVIISFLMYELAINEDIQEKCRREIQTVLKEHKNDLTGEAVSKLKYTESVMFESLRKHSPLLVLSRVCTNDYALSTPNKKEPNVIIEKNTLVVIPSKAIHHDPQYFPNPEVFNPDRFTDINTTKLPIFPFGDGPRICLGKNFALLQIKVFIVTILSEYKITLNKKTAVPYQPEFLQILNVAKEEIFVNFEKLSAK